MNNDAINKRIKNLEQELAGLKAELEVSTSKFQCSYTVDATYFIAETETLSGYKGNQTERLEHFRYRQTEENAKADFKLQKELMCIGALAEQLDPDYKSKISWNDTNSKVCVIFDKKTKRYSTSSNNYIRTLGTVYMPYDLALQICRILNDEQIEL